MISKNEVKYIQSLSDKKNRDAEAVFVAEGPKLVNELIANKLSAKIIYTTGDTLLYNTTAEQVKQIDAKDLERASQLKTPNEVLGIFNKPILPPLVLENKITLALDGIQDPGNLGTIIRTADWFGITQIVASPDTADCYNSKVVQSTMGSIARVNIYYVDLPRLLSKTSFPVLGATLHGTNVYTFKSSNETILVIGNEGKGISEDVTPFISQAITIPRYGNAESLNAAVATGILLAHLAKI